MECVCWQETPSFRLQGSFITRDPVSPARSSDGKVEVHIVELSLQLLVIEAALGYCIRGIHRTVILKRYTNEMNDIGNKAS